MWEYLIKKQKKVPGYAYTKDYQGPKLQDGSTIELLRAMPGHTYEVKETTKDGKELTHQLSYRDKLDRAMIGGLLRMGTRVSDEDLSADWYKKARVKITPHLKQLPKSKHYEYAPDPSFPHDKKVRTSEWRDMLTLEPEGDPIYRSKKKIEDPGLKKGLYMSEKLTKSGEYGQWTLESLEKADPKKRGGFKIPGGSEGADEPTITGGEAGFKRRSDATLFDSEAKREARAKKEKEEKKRREDKMKKEEEAKKVAGMGATPPVSTAMNPPISSAAAAPTGAPTGAASGVNVAMCEAVEKSSFNEYGQWSLEKALYEIRPGQTKVFPKKEQEKREEKRRKKAEDVKTWEEKQDKQKIPTTEAAKELYDHDMETARRQVKDADKKGVGVWGTTTDKLTGKKDK